jgi:hypothetical protein
MKEDEIIISNDDFLVTESSIRKNVSQEALASLLKDRKATASVTTRLLQGGTASIVVIEKTRITEKQRIKIREILGMV